MGFSSAFLFLERKREAITQGGIRGIDHLTRRRTQEASIVKGWEDKQDHERIPDTFTANKNNTSAGPQVPHHLNPDSLHATEWPIFIM